MTRALLRAGAADDDAGVEDVSEGRTALLVDVADERVDELADLLDDAAESLRGERELVSLPAVVVRCTTDDDAESERPPAAVDDPLHPLTPALSTIAHPTAATNGIVLMARPYRHRGRRATGCGVFGDSRPHPEFRSAVASPFIVSRMPRCTCGSSSPERYRRSNSTCKWFSGSRYGNRLKTERFRLALSHNRSS